MCDGEQNEKEKPKLNGEKLYFNLYLKRVNKNQHTKQLNMWEKREKEKG